MFFADENLALRKTAQLRALPPVPATGWHAPVAPPNLSAATAIGLDVETFDPELTTAGPGWARKRGHIVGISLAAIDRTGEIGAWYFPLRHTVEPEYNLNPENVFPWVRGLLSDSRPKVGANLLYDIGWLTEEFIEVSGKLYDVQFAEALIDADAKVSLEVLGQKYLNEGKTTNALYQWIKDAYRCSDRETRSNIYRSPPRLVGPYAESDARMPLLIMQRQWQQLRNEELLDLFELECSLIPVLVRMRQQGVNVNVERAIQLKEKLEEETITLYEKIAHEYHVEIDSCSTANLTRLFEFLGIRCPQTATGKPSFEKEWLKSLEHPIGPLINDIREHEKIIGTFLQSYIIEKNIDNKIYPQFHPLKGEKNGTFVGRFSSSDPNLQNIPIRTELGKGVRSCFIAEYGSWVKFDYSQLHYRILADRAIDNGDGSAEELRGKYRHDPNIDYHLAVYRSIAPLVGWSLTDKKEIKEKRKPIKNINFGLLYGQGEKSLAYKAGFTGKVASEFLKMYHKAAPYVKPTMEAIASKVQRDGYVTTLLDRRQRFNLWAPKEGGYPLPYDLAIKRYGTRIKRAYDYRGLNYEIQGTEADIMKTAIRKLHQSGVFEYTGYPRLTVHDELDFNKRENSKMLNEAFTFIRYTMENAVQLKVPLKVDMHEGPNWGEVE